MARRIEIAGCGEMLCAGYPEFAAALDQAFAGPKEKVISWRSVTARLAATAQASPSPLPDAASLQRELSDEPRPEQARAEPDLG